MGLSYADITVKSRKDGLYLYTGVCKNADSGGPEEEREIIKLNDALLYLRVQIARGAKCQFSYSLDGKAYLPAGEEFQAVQGRWIGAKLGLFCTRDSKSNDAGYADVDWFRVEKPLQKAGIN